MSRKAKTQKRKERQERRIRTREQAAQRTSRPYEGSLMKAIKAVNHAFTMEIFMDINTIPKKVSRN